MRPLAVFDLDGVLADVDHRVHHLEGRRKDWSAFFGAALDDGLLAQGQALALEAAKDCDIAYLTGRPEWIRHDTERWLRRHQLPKGRLVMRRGGDHRPARKAKLELLEQLARGRTVAVVVDDDLEVCDAYEGAGWPVLRATWAPRSDALHVAQEEDGRT
jgi:phosphoglycolate phosphatase-like HAD superfamily hydrolase